jgi:protein-S-isoprenylcysteine O-methyltransferase Ste14
MFTLNGYCVAFIITSLIWIVPEIWLVVRDRRIKPLGNKHNGISPYYISVIVIVVCLLLSNQNFLTMSITQNYRLLIGTLIIWAGLLIRWWAIFSLGKYFSVVVTIQSGQKLIKKGPYKYIRHPSYTGSLMIYAGFGLALGNWIGLAIIFIFPLVVACLRVAVEEKIMVSAFGIDYLTYMKQTARFIPFFQFR